MTDMRALGRLVVVGTWSAFVALAPAQAGLFDDDEARKAILDLRQRIDVVRQEAEQRFNSRLAESNQKSAEDAALWRRSLLDLQNQLEAMRADMARLRGQNEQLARDLAEIQRGQKDLTQTLDDRIRKLEPIKVSLEGRDFMVEPAEKRDYDLAMAVFRKGDFATAQLGFIDLMRRYPQSGYTPSALFWLGNAQYATRDYKEAVINFRALLTQWPEHARAPEALLSVANCQVELKDVKAARKALEDLGKLYPQSEAAAAARERLARLK